MTAARWWRWVLTAGFAVSAVGGALGVWAFRDEALGSAGAQWYEVAVVVSSALMAWAWWTVVPSLVEANDEGRLRLPLVGFAGAFALVALGALGELHDLERIWFTGYPLSIWTISTIVGSGLAALGFVGVSVQRAWSTGEEEPVGPPPDGTGTLGPTGFGRLPVALVLVGYAALAAGTAVAEQIQLPGPGGFPPKGEFVNDVALVASFALFGLAWWAGLGRLSAVGATSAPVRRALRAFALASAALALGQVGELPGAAGFDRSAFVGTLVVVGGFAAVAVGFWWTAGSAPQIRSAVPLVALDAGP